MSKQKNGFILLAMALGLLMASLDNTITSAAVSHIIKDIGGFDKMSWVFTAYMLAATSTMLVFGKMSDLFGRKRFYLIGIAIFLLGSALCGLAQNINQLIWFRALQGIGSGALFPISFTIIYTLFADPKQAAKLSGVLPVFSEFLRWQDPRSARCFQITGAGAGASMSMYRLGRCRF
jgi:MFS family permease